jgi:flagellar biosynthesis anti-sigma factor FlgM
MVLDVRNIDAGQAKALLGKAASSKKSSGATKSSAKTKSVEIAASEDDSVELTGLAGKISHLVNQMKMAPASNPDRISPIKDKLTKGEYNIEYVQVANKLLDFESAY